jgi:hypothetical protein
LLRLHDDLSRCGELGCGQLAFLGHALQCRDSLGIVDGAQEPAATPRMGQELVAPPRRGDIEQEVESARERADGIEQRRRIGPEGTRRPCGSSSSSLVMSFQVTHQRSWLGTGIRPAKSTHARLYQVTTPSRSVT